MNLFKIVIFSLLVIGAYSGFANSLPQVQNKVPPETTEIKGNITMEQFAAIGKQKVKEICALCHNPLLAGRAPDPKGTVLRAVERIKDPKYKEPDVLGTGGKAATAEEYIRESIMCPSCYVVPGFGKKGTNDMVSPMASVPSIKKLSPIEIDALIAFYQQRDGVEITVQLPSEKIEAPAEGEEIIFVTGKETPQEMITKLGCGECHTIPGVEGAEGDLGPRLEVKVNAALRLKDSNYTGKAATPAEYVRESILDPHLYLVFNEEEEEPFEPIMPPDFGEKISINALDKLVNFLLSIDSKKVTGSSDIGEKKEVNS